MIDSPDPVVGLAVALGAGLLIGFDRERRKGHGERRAAAGLRTFAIAAASGALAQMLSSQWLVPIGATFIAALGAISYWKTRSHDPGVTTELALLATYLIGALCMLLPAIGAACGAGLALLLAARRPLHRFATALLSEQELRDGILLAALALIVLPLIPSRPIPLLGGIDLRPLATLVLLIMAIQAAGHMTTRWLGTRGGVLASGFAAGFVSSTATIASFGTEARKNPANTPLLAGGASLSAVATWLEALVISATLSPGAGAALLPVAIAGAVGAAVAGLLPALVGARSVPPPPTPGSRSALRPREAFVVASTLALVALLVGNARRLFGEAGLMAGISLASIVDAHAPVASIASLHAADMLSGDSFVRHVLLAIGVNTLTRCAASAVFGGRAYALRVGLALVASLACACAAQFWLTKP